MEAALQRRIQRYGWDKAALYYENFWQRQLKPAQDKLLDMADIQPGEKIIDTACGTGLVSFAALEKTGPRGFLFGSDISDAMINTCIESAKGKNYFNTVFKRMDAEELNAENNGYDAALCALGLMYMPDPVKALKEMHRVVRPGGRAVAAVWGQRINCGWAEIFQIVDRRVASEVCPMFFNLGNKGALKHCFEMAGFTEVRVQRLYTTLIYENAEEAIGAAFAGGPVALAYNKFSEQVKQEVHEEYLQSIKQFHYGKGYAIPGAFVVARGFK